MAAMGREVNRRKPPQEPTIGIAVPAVNLVASPISVQPVTIVGFQPSPIGEPII